MRLGVQKWAAGPNDMQLAGIVRKCYAIEVASVDEGAETGFTRPVRVRHSCFREQATEVDIYVLSGLV